VGLECGTVRAAVWMRRMLVVINVPTQREGTVLFVPINPAVDPDGGIVSDSMELVYRLAALRGIVARA